MGELAPKIMLRLFQVNEVTGLPGKTLRKQGEKTVETSTTLSYIYLKQIT